jgi:hypothetical protein
MMWCSNIVLSFLPIRYTRPWHLKSNLVKFCTLTKVILILLSCYVDSYLYTWLAQTDMVLHIPCSFWQSIGYYMTFLFILSDGKS